MASKRHKRTRDIPHHAGDGRARKFVDGDAVHGHRKRGGAEFGARDTKTKEWTGVKSGRVKMEGGKSFPAHPMAIGAPPMRPPICMLFDDLAQDAPMDSTAVFGMYPNSLIPKILPWLRCQRREILHVCSGGLTRGDGIRVDVRAAARPDIVADGRDLPFADASIAAVLIDPPYSEHYARELYGTEYPRPSHLLTEAARVVRAGGRIGFVHYIVPNPPPGCHHVKTFGLSMGFGYPMRAITVYEKEQLSLFAAPSLI